MNAEHIERAFAELGARFRIEPQTQARRGNAPADYSMDIASDRLGQYFQLRVRPEIRSTLEVEVLQKSKPERHLLMLVKQRKLVEEKNRFLCGFDEREWFVAATPGKASNLDAAREALKPGIVQSRQLWEGLPSRQRHLRKNRVFRRQGEWFFLPDPNLVVSKSLILRNEPISRGAGSKPHMVEELYRTLGQPIYVLRSTRQPYWATDMEKMILAGRAKASDFTAARRNASVWARGKVSHPDHRAIRLHQWHQVVMNTENESAARSFLSFID